MLKVTKTLAGLLLLSILLSCSTAKNVSTSKPAQGVERVNIKGLKNLYKVDDQLYRSDQPDSVEMLELEQLGIKTALNLRNDVIDKFETKNSKLVLVHVPMNTFTVTYEEVVTALKVIQQAEKPVLVHCWFGSDRTGCVVAAYRIVKYGWTKEQAIEEFTDSRYGYHEMWFPNILKLLNSIDEEKLKRDVLEMH